MNNKRGFTLVELMVVIVIIGILAAVAVPRMMSAANRARAGEGPTILSAVATALHVHMAAQGTYAITPSTTTDEGEDVPGGVNFSALGISTPRPQFYTMPSNSASDETTFVLTMNVGGTAPGPTEARLGAGVTTGDGIGINDRDGRWTLRDDTTGSAFNNLVPGWANSTTANPRN